MRDRLVYLEISSWIGLSFGAQHYYGELHGRPGVNEYKTVKLTHILTPRQAARTNNYISSRYAKEYAKGMFVEAGDESSDFFSKDEIRKLARKLWLTHFPEAKILIEGRSSVGYPQRILSCEPADPEFIKSANKLCREFEAFEGYQHKRNWPKAEKIHKEWKDLIKKTFPGG